MQPCATDLIWNFFSTKADNIVVNLPRFKPVDSKCTIKSFWGNVNWTLASLKTFDSTFANFFTISKYCKQLSFFNNTFAHATTCNDKRVNSKHRFNFCFSKLSFYVLRL